MGRRRNVCFRGLSAADVEVCKAAQLHIYLFDSCVKGDVKEVRSALAAGAKPTGSMLFHALEDGQRDIARLLLRYGAKPSDEEEAASIQVLLASSPEMLAIVLEEGCPASKLDLTMELAVSSGETEAVRLLLDHGMPPPSGIPLAVACHKGYLEVVRLALRAGADPEDETTLIALALAKGHEKVAELLRRPRRCVVCKKGPPVVDLSRCSRCRKPAYCGVVCQKADWSQHAPTCCANT